MNLNKIQTLIDGDWQYAKLARETCVAGNWKSFIEKTEAKPFFLNFFAANSFKKCLNRCIELFEEPIETTMKIIPIWIGDNPDDMESNDWYIGHVAKVGPDECYKIETSPVSDDAEIDIMSVVTCKVRIWKVGYLVKSQYYAESIDLEIRDFTYGVLKGEVIEVLEIEAEDRNENVKRPTEGIAPFSYKYLPRVKNIGNELKEEIKKLNLVHDEV